MNLENLVSGSVKAAMKNVGAASADLWMVPIGDLKIMDGFNVRTQNEEYAAHVAAIGESILHNGYWREKPISVYVAKENDYSVLYVVDGHTRLAGARYAIEHGAEITHLPAVTKPAGTQVEDLIAGLAISNSGRPLTPIEKAAVCKRLSDYGMDYGTIAKRLGLTLGYVNDLLLLISAPKEVRKHVESGNVSAANATKALKVHGSEAGAKITQALTEAKAMGKTKATTATLAPKKPSLLDKGIAYIRETSGGHSHIAMLAYLADVSIDEIQNRMKVAA